MSNQELKEVKQERAQLKLYLFGFRYQYPPCTDPKILALFERYDILTQILVKERNK
jgi:hypothetical protein